MFGSAVRIESWIMAEFVPDGTVLRPLLSSGHDDLGQLTFAVGQIRDLTYAMPGEVSFFIRFPDAKRIGVEGRPAMHGDIHFTGTIIYTDSNGGHRRRSVFRRRWDDIRRSFYRIEDPDQEYSD
jgi:hypothetical protein